MQFQYTASALFTWPVSVPLAMGPIDSPELVTRLMPFFQGNPGGMTPEQVQAQITAGLSAQTYDFDALVAATLAI